MIHDCILFNSVYFTFIFYSSKNCASSIFLSKYDGNQMMQNWHYSAHTCFLVVVKEKKYYNLGHIHIEIIFSDTST